MAEEIEAHLGDAADVWQAQAWGWGEHLSEIYARIILDELLLLLLCDRELPDALRRKCQSLLDDLVWCEDAFAGGPRVPAIRSYAFASVPAATAWRDWIQPLPQDATFAPSRASGERLATCCTPFLTASGRFWYPLGHVFHSLGAAELLPRRRPVCGSFHVPCAGHSAAFVNIQHEIRLGSCERFPLMPSAEHATWGLSWQSFPVAIWAEDLWGFLQWGTLEAGTRRLHPAASKREGYLHNALTDSVQPLIVGRTFCRQCGGNLISPRLMPAVARTWEELVDRFRLVGRWDELRVLNPIGNWHQTILRRGPREVSFQCFTLTPGLAPALQKTGMGADWQLLCRGEVIRNLRCLATLWGISLGGRVTCPPQVTPLAEAPSLPRTEPERTWRVQWRWPDTAWDLRLDPLTDELALSGDTRLAPCHPVQSAAGGCL